MAKVIVFILDFYIGHALPTINLARDLQADGYKVAYLGIPDIENCIADQNFDFYPILSDVYPKGTWEKVWSTHSTAQRPNPGIFTRHLANMMAESPIDHLLKELKPSLLITSYFIMLETLILWYKHRIPTVIFTTFLREAHLNPANAAIESVIRLGSKANQLLDLVNQSGIHVRSLSELTGPLRHIPEIIPCPSELDFPDVDRGGNVHYIGPCVRDLEANEPDIQLPNIEKDSKLIYISLGSNVVSFPQKGRECYSLFFEVIRMARPRDWFFLFNFCPLLDSAEFEPIPDNVMVTAWVPQLKILSRTSLCINHGGLGTIKECIYWGVPMLVFPQGADQFKNSERIRNKRLGDIGHMEARQMIEQMEELLSGGSRTSGLRQFQELFRSIQDKHPGAVIVKNIMESYDTKTP